MDAANASVRLGAREVHVVYRRGPEQMPAFAFEYEHAKQEGVKFLWHVVPVRIQGKGRVAALELARVEAEHDGSFVRKAEDNFALPVDMVVLAIGQAVQQAPLERSGIKLESGHIAIDRATGRTSNPKYFAGGDCVNGGREVVDAVADGKRAGIGIAEWLEQQNANA